MPQENVLEFTKKNNNTRTHDVNLSDTDMDVKIYTNQTDRSLVTSSRNNKYIMI